MVPKVDIGQLERSLIPIAMTRAITMAIVIAMTTPQAMTKATVRTMVRAMAKTTMMARRMTMVMMIARLMPMAIATLMARLMTQAMDGPHFFPLRERQLCARGGYGGCDGSCGDRDGGTNSRRHTGEGKNAGECVGGSAAGAKLLRGQIFTSALLLGSTSCSRRCFRGGDAAVDGGGRPSAAPLTVVAGATRETYSGQGGHNMDNEVCI